MLALTALAFVVRTFGIENVLLSTGEVVLPIGDPCYHARRAYFSFEHFPFVLLWDPLLNYPDGASVPWPPLWDLVLAGVARLFARDAAGFDRVIVWLPPLLGALGVPLVYWIARTVTTRSVAAGAALLYALLPATIYYSDFGNVDHHAFVGFLGAALLLLYVRAARPGTSAARLVVLGSGLAVARAALLLTWPGGVIYVGAGDALLLLAGALQGRTGLLAVQGGSAVVSALLLAPTVAVSGTALGGLYSTVELSRLHPLALLALAAVTLASAILERARPARSARSRLLRLAAIAAPVAALVLWSTGIGAELVKARAFLAKRDDWGAGNFEEQSLYGRMAGEGSRPALYFFGAFAWLIPVAPLAFLTLVRDPARRAPALFLAAWTAVLGALAIAQVRFGNDYAPAGVVALALLTACVVEGSVGRLLQSPRARAALSAGVGLALLLPAILRVDAPRALATLAACRAHLPGDPALRSVSGSLYRFAQEIRRVTPETGGFSDVGTRPDYGIMVEPNIGHVIHYVAHRATPADNFGPYVGQVNFEAVRRFFFLPEPIAVSEARRLRTRYVVVDLPAKGSRSVLMRGLYLEDGRGGASGPRWEHFRLVTEGPRGGHSLLELSASEREPGGGGEAPYKLFEVVAGAVLEVHGSPETPVRAEVTVATPAGRRFGYVAYGVTDPAGRLDLRVPYATQTALPAAPDSPWRVQVGERAYAVKIDDEQVEEGAVLVVGAEGVRR